jgi:hypothetical protein
MRVAVRRVLIYTHRWLGICGCVLFIIWFASGIVMMYARMPQLTADERLAHLAPVDLSVARVGIADAARGQSIDRVVVSMLAGRPVYRFLIRGAWTTVFADTGEPLTGVDRERSLDLARRWAPEHASTIRYDAYLTDADQWTLSSEVRRQMPMHRIALGDADDSYIYIPERIGEPVLTTTARERRWAYAGAVLHWIYFTPLRRQSAAWAQLIIWSSIAGCGLCVSGLVWGVWRYSPSSRYRLKRERSHSPYAGLMRWHHYAGLIFGVISFTWVFSGLLSMDPWDWSPGTGPTRQQRETLAGGPLNIESVTLAWLRHQFDDARLKPGAPANRAGSVEAQGFSRTIREIEIVQFAGEPFVVSRDSPVRFDSDTLLAAARAAMPGVPVDEATWLDDYDAYYYDRDRERALPVLRVRFGDAARTWLYLDPRRGAIVRKEERLSRINRWLYHGLHSLDFPFLYYRRPLWDVVVIVLSLGGLVLSATTVTAAVHRLRRQARERAKSFVVQAFRPPRQRGCRAGDPGPAVSGGPEGPHYKRP